MFGIIDRFENDMAVVELDSGKIVNINKIKLPKEIKEGYVIRIDDTITVDYEKTKIRENEISQLTKDLWK